LWLSDGALKPKLESMGIIPSMRVDREIDK
jgi:hypothetical protein